jgi:beta-glucanase (GH16 family)
MDPEFQGTDTLPLGVNPFAVSGGVLTITGDIASPSIRPYLWNLEYTSGMISSESTFCQQYGLFEIRCKMPAGTGLRPTFWLLSCNRTFPPDIAVVDVFGNRPGHVFNSVVMTNSALSAELDCDGVSSSDGFHTYSTEWLPDQILWYVDGRLTHRLYREINEPMYMLVTLQMGGLREGTPDPASLPAKMEIDYIRAYARP